LYGTTSEGGGSGCDGSGCGTLFRIGLDGTDYAVVYAFSGGTTDGAHPVAAVIQASDGLLYGTTVDGGAVESRCTLGCGTVFRTSLYGTAFTVVHWFTPRDGIHPEASVVQASSGYLYGTTSTLGGGGSAGCIAPEVLECGTVFQMDLDGVEFNVRHVFSGAPDGNHPHAALIEATDGLLYGTTIFGGGNATDEPRLGIVFQMTPDGNVYRRYWLRKAGGFGTAYPYAALVEAADGNFYLTVRGFPGFKGAVLRMTADGGFTTLYSFSGEEDGGNPQAGLIQTADGTFYGTTSSGGLGRPGLGVVFRLIVRE